MTTFFKLLKENKSVAKTLVAMIQNMGDYDVSEENIESAMKNIRLSDLLSLNDAVEERDMGTIMDILEPFIPGMLPQTNEKISNSNASGARSTIGSQQPNVALRDRGTRQPTGGTGYDRNGQMTVPGGNLAVTSVGPAVVDANDIPAKKAGDPAATGDASAMTLSTGEVVPVPKDVAKKWTAELKRRAGV